jgi:GntR family transcriptional regulator/MocR family aminotransferase
MSGGPVDVHVSLSEPAGSGDALRPRPVPFATQIYRQLHDAIVDGRLRPGERLPATRELAQRLAVSRNTVAAAYDRLTAEGFLVGHVGAGTFVCTENVPCAPPRKAHRHSPVHPRKLWQTLPRGGSQAPTGPVAFNFGVGVPDATLFPLETWRRLIARELRPSALYSSNYRGAAGHAGLRAAIARSIGASRSVRASTDDVLVTHGAQQALDLIGRVLVEPGTCVAVEEPGYRPARRLFHTLGARVVGVPVDADGLVVDALPAAAKLVYVTPSHQFPLGVPMSLARRNALLGWAEERGAVIVEDDYDSEFRFCDRPLEPLQSLDRSGRVIYVGSFSKTLLPMLRIGFLVAPSTLHDALVAAKEISDWHGEPINQAALARFIDEGLLARHVRKATREYAARREQIVSTLVRDFRDVLSLVPSAAGLHVAALARPGVDVQAAVKKARAAGLALDPLSVYTEQDVHTEPDVSTGPDAIRSGLVLGYGQIARDSIPEGLRRLRASFAG